MTLYKDEHADLELIRGRRVAVIGYGNQGRAHALNLRDSGVVPVIGLRAGLSANAAAADGFEVLPIAEAAASANVVVMLLPDEAQPAVYTNEIAPHLDRTVALGFAHGFCVRFGLVVPPEENDVFLVSPMGPGTHLRGTYEAGRGIPCVVATHPDGMRRSLALALSYAKAIGCTRAGAVLATFEQETDCDLFGEQAILVGGLISLVRTGYDTLVENGYPPELAWAECFYQVRLLADLLHDMGPSGMLDHVSDTAAYGGLTRGPEIFGHGAKMAMQGILADISHGRFAKEWMREAQRGGKRLADLRNAAYSHPIEQTVAIMARALAPAGPPPDPGMEGEAPAEPDDVGEEGTPPESAPR
jgi:ketol-acid reductoisomerase